MAARFAPHVLLAGPEMNSTESRASCTDRPGCIHLQIWHPAQADLKFTDGMEVKQEQQEARVRSATPVHGPRASACRNNANAYIEGILMSSHMR